MGSGFLGRSRKMDPSPIGGHMNEQHLKLCSSVEWGTHLKDSLLPWVLGGVDLGPSVMEVGPGPGLTTDLLRNLVPALTAVEIDETLANPLATRMAGSNVRVVNADATALPFGDAIYSGATSFTMLHHVPTPELQDQLLAEVCRVLAPGGIFAGCDSLASEQFLALHEGDICVPISPDTFGERLERAGFRNVSLETRPGRLRFVAHKPARS